MFNLILFCTCRVINDLFAHPQVQSSTEKDHDQETLWTSMQKKSTLVHHLPLLTCTESVNCWSNTKSVTIWLFFTAKPSHIKLIDLSLPITRNNYSMILLVQELKCAISNIEDFTKDISQEEARRKPVSPKYESKELPACCKCMLR